MSDRGVEGPPDLIVEITSPSTAARDRGVKLERYRHFGVSEYGIVDADAGTADVWRAGADVSERYGADDRLPWTPEPGGPTLMIELEDIVGGC